MYELPIDPTDEFTYCPIEDDVANLLIEEINLYLGAISMRDRIVDRILPTIKLYGMYVLDSLARSGSTMGIHRPPSNSN